MGLFQGRPLRLHLWAWRLDSILSPTLRPPMTNLATHNEGGVSCVAYTPEEEKP